MKNASRFCSILLLAAMIVAACFAFSGCARSDVPQQGADPAAQKDTDSRGNAMMDPKGLRAVVNGDLLFFTDPGDPTKLCYLNLETGEKMLLCAKPECTHKGTDCGAYVGNAKNIMTDGSRLYWTEKVLSSKEWKLFSMNTDGTDRRTEAELEADKLDSYGDEGAVCIKNNKLFLCTCSSGISGGQPTYSTLVFSHDLKSGAEETLFEETSGRACLGRVVDDKLYFALFDSENIAFNSCDLATGEVKELHTDAMPSFASEPMQMYYSGGYLLVIGSFDCWAYDIANDSFFALRQWTEDPTGETAVAFCTGERILLYRGMNEYRFEDMSGNILSEGAIKAEGFNESAFSKEPIGCAGGKILLRFDSMDDDETPYILSFDTETFEWKTEWDR